MLDPEAWIAVAALAGMVAAHWVPVIVVRVRARRLRRWLERRGLK